MSDRCWGTIPEVTMEFSVNIKLVLYYYDDEFLNKSELHNFVTIQHT